MKILGVNTLIVQIMHQGGPESNPFSLAGVVFPAVSRASVLSRILWIMSAISATPPALSLMGPYASITNLVAMVLDIPRAVTTIPYIGAKEKLTKMLTMIAKIGIMTDLYPNASPKITLVAAPVWQESATS